MDLNFSPELEAPYSAPLLQALKHDPDHSFVSFPELKETSWSSLQSMTSFLVEKSKPRLTSVILTRALCRAAPPPPSPGSPLGAEPPGSPARTQRGPGFPTDLPHGRGREWGAAAEGEGRVAL